MKNLYEINRALVAKKKFFTSLLVSLFAVSTYAELAYEATFAQSDFNTSSTVVKKEGTIEWDTDHVRCGGSSNGISFGGPSWNWDDKYFDVKLANGVPNKLTFEWACNNVTSTNADWYVKESADGTKWSAAIWEKTSSTTSWTKETMDLQPTTRYLRFCFSGNFAGNFKNIKVTEKILMGTPNPETLDFGTVKVDDLVEAKEFTLGWTNLEATAVSSDEHFTVTPGTFGTIGLAYQTEKISVGLNTNEAGTFSGTITIEGRDKSASVTVSGTVEKYDQTLTWEPADSYNYGDPIALATASSGLDATYEIADPTILVFEAGALRALKGGSTTVTAKQEGNYKYNAASEIVKTITIVSPTLYGDYDASVCEGDSVEFHGKKYGENITVDINVGLNSVGGDSIVHFSLVVNPIDTTELNETLKVGQSLEVAEDGWTLNDQPIPADSYVQNAEAAFDLIRTVANIYGCDSVIIRHIVVEPAPIDPTGMGNIMTGERAYKEFHNGVLYIRRGEALYTVTGEKVE